MQIIEMDARDWKTAVDFCEDLFQRVGAMNGHGCGIDALNETFVWGGVNDMSAPFTVRISSLSSATPDVREFLVTLHNVVKLSRVEFRAMNGHEALGMLEFLN